MSAWNLPPRQPSRVPEFVRALPANGGGALAIFDADGTMWCNDVADDFARWMMAEGHVPDDGRWAEYVRIYRQDHAAGCEHMLTFYAGLTQRRLHELVEHWWLNHSHRDWVVEVVESMHWLAEHGYTIWVVTGSPTDTMLPLRDVLPIERVVGIDFEVDGDGVLTGRREGIRCADAGKAEKVRSLWPSGAILFAAGNGSLDAAMMELSTAVAWAVYPNAAFQAFALQRGWPILPRPADFVEEAKLA